MKYTVKNTKNDQDNINFIDLANEKESWMPSFLEYDEVLHYSLKNGNLTSEDKIKSLCDGGDYVKPYFSENDAAHECSVYLEYTTFEVQNSKGEWETKTLEFDKEKTEYELF